MPARPATRLARRWLPPLLALVALGGWSATGVSQARPASVGSAASTAAPAADPGTEAQFVDAINDLRASKGLRRLQVSGELVGVARRWTDRMVSAGHISHNPSLGSQVGGSWRKLGENVGVGYDVAGLMKAFSKSPLHYRNLVDPEWTHLGVGVSASNDGRIYTTHNFMYLPGGGAPPPPAPPPATTTTAPPTTTPPPPPPPPPPPTTTTTLPPPPPEPEPSEDRVTAVLEPLRSLEAR